MITTKMAAVMLARNAAIPEIRFILYVNNDMMAPMNRKARIISTLSMSIRSPP